MDNQNSRKIEQLADRLRNDNNKDNLNLLVKELEQGTLYVPAAIPPGTDPALIRQLISGSGMEQGTLRDFLRVLPYYRMRRADVIFLYLQHRSRQRRETSSFLCF